MARHSRLWRRDDPQDENASFTTETIDALGHATRVDRDPQGEVLATTDPLGRVTRFECHGVRNVTRVIDAEGNVRTFTYSYLYNLG